MNKEKYYIDYCTGCGLCKNAVNISYFERSGFLYPESLNKEQIEFCEKVCPVNAINYNKRSDDNLWGFTNGCFNAWSTDKEIRYKSASGGTITALCCFLLESKKCDAIIQVNASSEEPYTLSLNISKTKEEVISCASSIYITFMTYEDLENKIDYKLKYAVVGKPCDIEAITNYMRFNSKLNDCIKYRLTFFCAGAPSVNANRKLARALTEKPVKSIKYRGNGWPGKAEITATDGTVSTMEYIDSWNNYLGRDIRKMCKFCTNGVGMFCDISCGDLWRLNNNKPVFDERPGENIVFARSKKGNDLLVEASKAKYITLNSYDKLNELQYIQPNHYNMQTRAYSKQIGLIITSLFSRQYPKYKLKLLKKYSKQLPLKISIKTILGTVKRKITNKL